MLAGHRSGGLPGGRSGAAAVRRFAGVRSSRPVRTFVALLAVASMVIAGCGGSAKPTATAGCKGPSPARQSASFNSDAGDALLTRQATIASVCAHFGRPTAITHASDGSVTWSYGEGHRAALVSFKHDHVVGAAWFDQGAPNATYSISQSETVSTFSGDDKLHSLSGGRSDCFQSTGQTLPGAHGFCK